MFESLISVVAAVLLLLPFLGAFLLCTVPRHTDLVSYGKTAEGRLVLPTLIVACCYLGISFASASLDSGPSFLSLLVSVAMVGMLWWRVKKGTNPSPSNLERMDGKVVIVTGGNTGIGFASVMEFVKLGADVVIATRDPTRGKAAADEVNEQTGSKRAHFMQLDLASLANVPRFVKQFRTKFDRLDVLVNNAGGVPMPGMVLTKEGYEPSFATMHLAHFLLTRQLLPMIEHCHGRIVNVSSEGHRVASTEQFDDFTTIYSNTLTAYGRSKLCNVLFTFELQRRLGGKVQCFTLHPGSVYTGNWNWQAFPLPRFIPKTIMAPILDWTSWMTWRSSKEGCADVIHCSASKDCEGQGGKYYLCCRPYPSSELSLDTKLAAKLWEKSEEFVQPFIDTR